MTKDDFKPGDLVECYGKRWIVSGYGSWEGSGFMHAGPATKAGNRDKRYEGQYIDAAKTKLIKRATP